jgi:FAD/FMN-containing dehydrogenase
VPSDATAFGLRSEQYSIGIFAVWEDPGETAIHQRWAREAFAAVQPFSTGRAYVNYLGEDAGSQLRASFGGNYDRLVDVKTEYDRDNVFHHNQNIRPKVE